MYNVQAGHTQTHTQTNGGAFSFWKGPGKSLISSQEPWGAAQHIGLTSDTLLECQFRCQSHSIKIPLTLVGRPTEWRAETGEIVVLVQLQND